MARLMVMWHTSLHFFVVFFLFLACINACVASMFLWFLTIHMLFYRECMYVCNRTLECPSMLRIQFTEASLSKVEDQTVSF